MGLSLVSLAKTYVKSHAPSGTYPDTNGVELTDGSLGSTSSFSDATWQGHDMSALGVEAWNVVVDLGYGEASLGQFKSYHFSSTGDGIFIPEHVEILTSPDNVLFTSQGKTYRGAAVNDAGSRWVYTLTPAAGVGARYVKFIFTRQASQQWIFTAEVEVYASDTRRQYYDAVSRAHRQA